MIFRIYTYNYIYYAGKNLSTSVIDNRKFAIFFFTRFIAILNGDINNRVATFLNAHEIQI